MTQTFTVRCTPANPEWASYLVQDGTGEVRSFATAGQASGEACDRQERAFRNGCNVSYSVEAE